MPRRRDVVLHRNRFISSVAQWRPSCRLFGHNPVGPGADSAVSHGAQGLEFHLTRHYCSSQSSMKTSPTNEDGRRLPAGRGFGSHKEATWLTRLTAASSSPVALAR